MRLKTFYRFSKIKKKKGKKKKKEILLASRLWLHFEQEKRMMERKFMFWRS